jgi:hypothetical protein
MDATSRVEQALLGMELPARRRLIAAVEVLVVERLRLILLVGEGRSRPERGVSPSGWRSIVVSPRELDDSDRLRGKLFRMSPRAQKWLWDAGDLTIIGAQDNG